MAGNFETFREWVHGAEHVLTAHPEYKASSSSADFRAICFDAKGRLCRNGFEFGRANDDRSFPVTYVWPDEVPALYAKATAIDAETPLRFAVVDEGPARRYASLTEALDDAAENIKILRGEGEAGEWGIGVDEIAIYAVAPDAPTDDVELHGVELYHSTAVPAGDGAVEYHMGLSITGARPRDLIEKKANELDRIAAELGDVGDPFAVWESIAALRGTLEAERTSHEYTEQRRAHWQHEAGYEHGVAEHERRVSSSLRRQLEQVRETLAETQKSIHTVDVRNAELQDEFVRLKRDRDTAAEAEREMYTRATRAERRATYNARAKKSAVFEAKSWCAHARKLMKRLHAAETERKAPAKLDDVAAMLAEFAAEREAGSASFEGQFNYTVNLAVSWMRSAHEARDELESANRELAARAEQNAKIAADFLDIERRLAGVRNYIRILRDEARLVVDPVTNNNLRVHLEDLEASLRLGTEPPVEPSPISSWFGLSHDAYLTVPRLALEAMPLDWQSRFVLLLREADATGLVTPLYHVLRADEAYTDVELEDPRDEGSRLYELRPVRADEWADYRHGDVSKLCPKWPMNVGVSVPTKGRLLTIAENWNIGHKPIDG